MVVPCATLVTTPVVRLIVAILVLLLVHVPFVDASLNVVVCVPPPWHMVVTPVIAPGVAFTVAVMVAALPHPLL